MIFLDEARKQTMDAAHNAGGTTCPICGKHVQVYRRKFNSRMAQIIMDIYPVFEKHPGRYLEIGNYCAKRKGYISGEHAKLVWWELLEKRNSVSVRGAKSSGLYRITAKGFDFVYNRIRVPSHIVEYRSQALRWEGSINIIEALGSAFNYPELINQNIKIEEQRND